MAGWHGQARAIEHSMPPALRGQTSPLWVEDKCQCIPMCHRTSPQPYLLTGKAGNPNMRARTSVHTPQPWEGAQLPMPLAKTLAPRPSGRGTTGPDAVMRGSYRRTRDVLLSPPGTPLAATLPLAAASPGSGSGDGSRGGGGYRTPRRSQRYIVLPGSTGPEPLVLVNYASPAAANEELALALAQEMMPMGQAEPGLPEPHRSHSLPPQFDDKPRSSSGNGGFTGGGDGSVAGRAVLVAKGSQMVYLAAHVLSNIGEGLRQGGERDGGPRGGDTRQYRKVQREREARITVVYSDSGEVRSVCVLPLQQEQGISEQQQQQLRHWANEPILHGLVFRPCKYDKDTAPPVDSRARGKKEKPSAIITCTHYLRVRQRPGAGAESKPLDSGPGSGGWCDHAPGGHDGYNGHRWERLVQQLSAAELRKIATAPDEAGQPLELTGREKLGAAARAVGAEPAPSPLTHPSTAVAAIPTPSGAGGSCRQSQHPPSQLLVAINRTNHLQLKKQVRWIIHVDFKQGHN